MTPSVHGRPTLPCRIGTVAATCIIDTGSAVALSIPAGMAVAGQAEPFSEGVTGATGQSVQGRVEDVALRMAGEVASVWAVAIPGYSGLPLVGDPGLKALGAIVVVDAAQGTDWFVTEPSR